MKSSLIMRMAREREAEGNKENKNWDFSLCLQTHLVIVPRAQIISFCATSWINDNLRPKERKDDEKERSKFFWHWNWDFLWNEMWNSSWDNTFDTEFYAKKY